MRARNYIFIALLTSVVSLGIGCSSNESNYRVAVDSPLKSESDSLAYIIGMNVAKELQKMDSLINYDVVCRAIMEHSQGKLLMSDEEARSSYIRYLLYVEPERRRSIEERFLIDLSTTDRSFTRTKSGLTYKVEVIGDEKNQPKNATDWLTLSYYISRVGGDLLLPAQPQGENIVRETSSMALEDLPLGVQEALKMIGRGGHIRAWVPSKLAFGEEGNEELGVEPVETLYYDIKIVNMERNAALKYRLENF